MSTRLDQSHLRWCPDWSLDDLVRPREHGWRDRQAEGLGSLEVKDQLELGRLLDGEVGGLGALENLVHEDGGAAEEIREVSAVTDESTSLGILLRSAGTRQAACEGAIGDPWVARKKGRAQQHADGCVTCSLHGRE